MTKITVAHGNGIMPEKMDIKLTISKEAGDQIEMNIAVKLSQVGRSKVSHFAGW